MLLPTPLALLCLALAIGCYGTSTLVLSAAAGRQGESVHRSRYLLGMAAQAGGFGFSFLARTVLPLLLVQAGATASVAVSAVVGAAQGRWRLTRTDLLALPALVLGLALAAAAVAPGPAHSPGAGTVLAVGLVAAASALGVRGSLGTSACGALAGIGFGASAFGARVLASLGTPGGPPLRLDLVTAGCAVLLIGGLLVGQVLLTAGFRRGGVAGPVTAMYLVSTLGPSAAGLTWLGDALQPGRTGWAAAGVTLALAAAARLVRLTPHP